MEIDAIYAGIGRFENLPVKFVKTTNQAMQCPYCKECKMDRVVKVRLFYTVKSVRGTDLPISCEA